MNSCAAVVSVFGLYTRHGTRNAFFRLDQVALRHDKDASNYGSTDIYETRVALLFTIVLCPILSLALSFSVNFHAGNA